MVYKDKARDMKRAPLPSRAYKSARADKRNARKRSRQHARQLTHNAQRFGWDEAIESHIPDWDNMHGWHGTRGIVRRRRDADNLGALMRWAESLANHNPDAPPDELRLKVREIIGWDYMADHLMSHVENIEAFDINPVWRRWSVRGRGSRNPAELTEKMIKICEDLWLRGQNKKLHEMASNITSHREIPSWDRYTIQEPIYRWNEDYTKRVFTGNFKTRYYWTRRIFSHAEIAEVVEEWVQANYTKVHDYSKLMG